MTREWIRNFLVSLVGKGSILEMLRWQALDSDWMWGQKESSESRITPRTFSRFSQQRQQTQPSLKATSLFSIAIHRWMPVVSTKCNHFCLHHCLAVIAQGRKPRNPEWRCIQPWHKGFGMDLLFCCQYGFSGSLLCKGMGVIMHLKCYHCLTLLAWWRKSWVLVTCSTHTMIFSVVLLYRRVPYFTSLFLLPSAFFIEDRIAKCLP